MLAWSGFRHRLPTSGKAQLTGHSVQNQCSLGCDVSGPMDDAFHYTIGVATPSSTKSHRVVNLFYARAWVINEYDI